MPSKYLLAADVSHFGDNAFEEYFSNPKYIELIMKKFSPKVVEHIRQMLKIRFTEVCLRDRFGKFSYVSELLSSD